MSELHQPRPVKQFRAKVAFGPYSVGSLLQPTGLYRDMLLRKDWIEEVVEVEVPQAPDAPAPRAAGPLDGAAKGRKHRMLAPDLLRNGEE